MTVNQLHKTLSNMIAQGRGRMPVVVDKATFTHNCEGDGVTILPVSKGFGQWIGTSDDDGGTKFNKDGTEAGKTCFLLVGDAYEDSL